MVRRALVFVLIVLAAVSPVRARQAATDAAVPQAGSEEKIASPTFVEVRLRDGSRVRGYLVQVTSDALHVQVDRVVRALPVTDVLTIERHATGKETGAAVAKGAGLYVVYFLATVGGLALLAIWACSGPSGC